MTDCRDWLSTLWSASYMGVRFFFESDDEEGGRDLKVHKFPGRDAPFVEDMGAKERIYEGSAYISGDDVDTQSIDLADVFGSPGPGTLVVPLLGPVQVHCETFKRHHEKDKLGYVAFTVKFVRDGASSALISVGLAGQQVLDQADAMASSIAGVLARVLTLAKQPDYVVSAAAGSFEAIAASIEVVRTSNPIDPDASAIVRDAAAAIFAAAPLLILPTAVDDDDVATLLAGVPALDETFSDPAATLGAATIATIRALGDGMDGATAAAAMLDLALSFQAPAGHPVSDADALAIANTTAVMAVGRHAALIAWAEALQRQTYASRPDGVAARAQVSERFEIELNAVTGADQYPLYVAMQDLRGGVVAFLTQLIVNLAPLVSVSAPQQMPALWWAWRLYGDPLRAVDLVTRNEVRHPSFMPMEFAALAPGFAAPTVPAAWPAP